MNLIKIVIIVIFVIGAVIIYSLVDWQKSTDVNLIDAISNFAEINFSDFPLTNEPSRPNIVVIMTDDLDVSTFKVMLDKGWMQNTEKFLLERGTDFTNSFVTNSECCPSRSTFLTGQYSHNHGVLLNPLAKNLDDNHTIATWLHNVGYKTGLVGKYLNHYGLNIDANYIPPGWDSWHVLIDPYTNIMYDYQINNNGDIINFGNSTSDYQTDVLARLSNDFIVESESIDNIPFFLLVAPTAPHGEKGVTETCTLNGFSIGLIRGPERYKETAKNISFSQPPSFNETDVSDKPKWIQEFPLLNKKDLECIEMIYQNRIESMRAVDDLIGQVVETLIDKDEYDDTLIIFTSDNGFLFGEHREWSKFNVYEESIRVPLIISAPGYRIAQSTSNLVLNNDLAPTILDFAGTESDISVDGRSLASLLSSPQQKWRNNFLVEHWKPEGFKPLEFLPTFKAIRTTSHLYVEYEDGSREFYDLINDPYQMDNQYNCEERTCLKQIEFLQSLLLDLKNCGNGTCQLIENELKN